MLGTYEVKVEPLRKAIVTMVVFNDQADITQVTIGEEVSRVASKPISELENIC